LGNAPRKKNGMIDWKTMNAMASEALAELGIQVDVTQRLNRQSIAIQQMVSVARALSINSKLLIMDEATSSLDAHEVSTLFRVIDNLRSRGISTVFITHKMDEIYRICDRVTILKDGEFVTCEPIEDLPKLKLISLMIGRDASDLINKHKEYDPTKQEGEILCELHDIHTADRRLNGINIQIHKGEVLGLAGLLGSGRTETAKVIFGDEQNYVGEIRLRQAAVRFKAPFQSIKAGLAFCPEDRKAEGIFPEMSVMDNLTMPVLDKLNGVGLLNRRKQAEITDEYIDRMSIKTPNMFAKIKDLSGGNQQKVILSRWLATKPDLIILDEPTRGIDVGAKGEIEELIRQIAAEGISVLYISSELDELVRGCDRVLVLREGKNTAEFIGDQISADNIMRAYAESKHA
jgi:ABC-type sugar transport system ATPase subunit